MENRLKVIIADYKFGQKQNPDQLLEYCRTTGKTTLVIRAAATARFNDNKKHSHQNKIKNELLMKFGHDLVLDVHNIERASNFPELMRIIEGNKVKGIGQLAIYDTAHRIGANPAFNLEPDKVYLHSGTKIGARRLLKRTRLPKFLMKTQFDPLMHSLKNSEIEDILCIYKDDFDLNKPFKPRFPCTSKTKSRKNGCA